MDMFEKRCAECAEMKAVKGTMTCAECFGQKCAEIDDCPLGITAEAVEEISKADKGYKLCAQAEKKERKPRERKVNEDKLHIMNMIKAIFEGLHCPIEIINPEREITFEYKGVKYKLTLAVPRK